ncbi:MAG: hypothetical protein H6658_12775 [Ardenticatenaceae bacterium]|nr:hypothetical protein [Ardenticatenaceae bacterium]
MQEIGQIIRLQIQVDSLKSGQRPFVTYSPAHILSVNSLRLTPQGAWGLLPDGPPVMDAHHEAHHAHKYRGNNGLSLNFSSHYGRIQERFGERLAMGSAGENILVETAQPYTLAQLGHRLLIQSGNGHTTALHQISVAAPCEPFSRYCLNLGSQPPAAAMKATLQFLDNGMRGFYLTVASSSPQFPPVPQKNSGELGGVQEPLQETAVTIHLGDRLFLDN